MSEWKECVLADVTVGRGEYGIAASAVEYSRDKYTYLRITDIKDDGTIDFSGLKSVDEPNAKRYLLEPNDIVFARTGASTGRSYFYDGRDGQFVYAGFLIKFSLDPAKVFPQYVKYHCLSEGYRAWVSQTMTGSTRGNINAVTLGQMPLRLPSLPTQRKIAAVLGALDDKIVLNRKMNANLEAMAQALFKSWFVDFEPFGKDRKEVAEGVFVPDELDMVQVASLNPTLETGKRPKGGASASGIPSVGAESVKQLGDFDYLATKFVPEEFAAKMSRGKINGYEVLLYKDGGKPGTFIPHFSMFGEGFPYDEFFINEHVFKLDAGSPERNVFLLFNFQTEVNVHWFESCGAKAAVPGINQSNVFDAWVFNPDQPKAKEFGAIVLPMVTRILKNCRQNRTLAQLRDALLPKLMSGELDVEAVKVEA